MTNKIWSEWDDHKLWSLRSKPTSELATIFNKTSGAIRSRLKHLNDPNHRAYQRRIRNATGHIMAADENCAISAYDLKIEEIRANDIRAAPARSAGGQLIRERCV